MHDLLGRTAVITGAAGELGSAIARSCAAAGMQLLLIDSNTNALDDVANLIRLAHPVDVLAMLADVSDAQQVARAADQAADRFGDISLLMNNAGIVEVGAAWETSASDWRRILDVNVMGIVHCIQSFLPRMVASGVEGHIVNVSSMAGLLGAPGLGAYGASKHAIVGLSQALAYDLKLRRSRVAVSVVCPGFLETPLGSDPPRAMGSNISHRMMQRRATAPGQTADVVADFILDAVRLGTFFVLTHPNSQEALAQHRTALALGRLPRLTPF